MNAPTKYCIKCLTIVSTKTIGRKVHCARCNVVLEELPIESVLTPQRGVGFGAAPTYTKRRGTGW